MRHPLPFGIGAATLLLAGCARNPPPPPPASDPPASQSGEVRLRPDSPKLRQLRIEAVSSADVPVDEVVAPGKVAVNPNRLSHIVLPVPGRITEVHVRLGDSVRQGQALLDVESPEADAAHSAYLQAQAGVIQAQAASTKAQADLDRLKDLFEHNAVARKDVLNAESMRTQSGAAVEQAQAALSQARRRLEILGLQPGQFGQKVIVHSPISGKVLDMTVVPGEYRNDTNAALLTVADLSTVWISSDVPESSIRRIHMSERLEAELAAYPGEKFSARVTRIADTVDSETRTLKVMAEIQNRDSRLRPEMFGRIRHVEDIRCLPVLPAGAVVQGDGQTVVYVETAPGVFRQTQVTVGDRMGDRFPVLRGVREGERVVVDGTMLLKGF